MNIYFLGNPLIDKDTMPIKLMPLLKKEFSGINFIHFDPTEEIPKENHFVLIDSVEGIKDIKILTEKDISKIQNSPQISLHDFDLGFQLKLSMKLNRISKFTIIGIPIEMNEKKAFIRMDKVIKKMFLIR